MIQCPLMALLGPRQMSDLSPLKRTKADMDRPLSNRDFMSHWKRRVTDPAMEAWYHPSIA
jgi:hypothetical protein